MDFINQIAKSNVLLTIGIGFLILVLYLVYVNSTLKRTDYNTVEDSPTDYLKKRNETIFKKLNPYDMKQYWYAVCFSSELTKDKPKGILLLDEPLVLYRTKDGIECAQDRCPHRSAKLSLGRMVEGSVECLYHGWAFGDSGKCTRIPSKTQDSQMEKLVCLETKVVKEILGVIWVWAGEAKLADESLIPKFIFRERGWENWNFFEQSLDLKYGHDLMIENLMDLAHLDFVHDGSIGKRSSASPVTFTKKEDEYTKTHPNAFSHDSKKENDSSIVNTIFIPPCYVKNIIIIEKTKYLIQDFCLLPCSKNEMKILLSFHQTLIPTFITKYILPTPIAQYFQKKSSLGIIYEDDLVLTSVNDNLRRGSKKYSKINQSDSAIKKYKEEFYEKALVERNPWFKGYETKDIEDLQ